jgi:bacillithiol biosynthesis cysteine-adding enzyme BshC
MNLPRVLPTPVSSRFLNDYLAGAPALARFYSGHPLDSAAYTRKALEVHARMTPALRQRVRDAYRPLNDAARLKLDAVMQGRGFVVTTGQQAGVFTGPLYTIYKALSAVRLAAELERHLRCPVLAVFWVAADDHDWAEVDHIDLLDERHYLRTVRVPADSDAPQWPMSRRLLGSGVDEAVAALSESLPQEGFGRDTLEIIRRTYTAGRSVAAAFEDMLAEVLGDFPIAIVSSAHPAVKQASLPVMLYELENAAAHEQLITVQTELLRAAGYKPQVTVTPSASNVFLLRDAGRDRLVRQRGGWTLRRTGERIEHDDLLAQVQADPEMLSANVFLRPVIESSVFPTLSYVGGPAETTYFAQIGCLFEAHDIAPPVVFPRHGLTIIDHKTEHALERVGHTVNSVRAPFGRLVGEMVRRDLPAVVRAAIEAAEAAVSGAFGEVERSVPAVDPTLAGPVRSAGYRAAAEIKRTEKRIEAQYRRNNEARIEQLRKAAAVIYPGGAPQERVLNIVPFLAKWGRGLIQAMHDAMPVVLDRSVPDWAGVKCDMQQELDVRE